MPNKTITNKSTRAHAPYKAVKAALSEQVSKGRWTKGSMIPGQRDLAREFNVSVPTLQRAIADMVEEGVLRIENRRGTFVAFGDSDADEEVTSGFLRGEQILRPVSPVTTKAVVGVISMIQPGNTGYVSNVWIIPLVQDLENALFDLGFTSRFYNRYRPDGTFRSTWEVAQDALNDGVGAIVLTFPEVEELRQFVRQIDPHIPLLCMELQTPFTRGYIVRTDGVNAGYQAATHLLSQGCKSLMFVSPCQTFWTNERIVGAKYALDEAGQDPENLKVFVLDGDSDKLKSPWQISPELADSLFENGPPTDGIIAANDNAALSLIAAATKRGLIAGRDYGIVGFDDTVASREMGLTTMHPPLAAMAKEGAALITAAINGSTLASTVLMKSRLVVRSSSTLKR